MASKLAIPSSEIEQGMPIRTITSEMMGWIAGLDVLDVGAYPLPGGQERRTFDPDPRFGLKTMIAGGVNLSPKNSDLVTYYEHVATIHHTREGVTFIAFKMTMDALFAMQKDPQRFPAWLMKSHIKKSELRVYFAVVSAPPRPDMSSIYQWLVPVEDAFPGAETWMYDALAYFITRKGILKEEFFKKS
jgi:hypothetical protein